MSDLTATEGWYGGYPQNQTRLDYGAKPIYQAPEVYTGSQVFSQPMPTT